MGTDQQLVTLKLRIRLGEAETQRWRLAGSAEKYLESFCNVESLERQLDELMRKNDVALRATPAADPSSPGEP